MGRVWFLRRRSWPPFGGVWRVVKALTFISSPPCPFEPRRGEKLVEAAPQRDAVRWRGSLIRVRLFIGRPVEHLLVPIWYLARSLPKVSIDYLIGIVGSPGRLTGTSIFNRLDCQTVLRGSFDPQTFSGALANRTNRPDRSLAREKSLGKYQVIKMAAQHGGFRKGAGRPKGWTSVRAGIDADLTKRICTVGSIAHQPAGFGIVARFSFKSANCEARTARRRPISRIVMSDLSCSPC
jgi:hypothetical protein